MAAGATPERISYGNTIKKEKDIARAYALGIRLFAVDCEAEVEKIARAAPGSKVFCRILCGVRRRRMAAFAQIRLRAGDGRCKSSNTPIASGSSLMACRSTSARSSPIRACGTAR